MKNFFIPIFVILGVFFLSGCGQQSVDLNESTDFLPIEQQSKSVDASFPTQSPSYKNNDKVQANISTLTPQTLNEIVQKIKSAPNSIIKLSANSDVGNANFYYSVSSDPLDPKSKEALVFEIETITHVDENGKKYAGGSISDLIQMRDTDFDTFPNDYWTDEFGEDLKFRPLTQDTQGISDFLLIWANGMAYFRDNILQ